MYSSLRASFGFLGFRHFCVSRNPLANHPELCGKALTATPDTLAFYAFLGYIRVKC